MCKLIRQFVFMSLLFVILGIQPVQAEDTLPPAPVEPETSILSGYKMPGHLEGIGKIFELHDSTYLNISVSSLEQIKLTLDSVPEMVTMQLEAVDGARETQITLSGLVPEKTYHKYEDNYHNHVEFIADINGNYAYNQDLLTSHTVFIQTRPSTKFIRDDATGGDCSQIGTWDSFAKTCVLSTDLNETIQIESDGVILDGNNHSLTGYNTGNGVVLSHRTNVTIKNLNIKMFSNGINLIYSNNNTLIGNVILNNGSGIITSYSSNNSINGNNVASNYYGLQINALSNNNILTNNTVSLNRGGLFLDRSNSNILNNNKISNNYLGFRQQYSTKSILSGNIMSDNQYNFTLGGMEDAHYDNNIDISNLVDGKPIYYVRNASYQTYNAETNAGLFYCINCYGVIIEGITTAKNDAGILFWNTHGSTVRNIVAANNLTYGILLYGSNYNELRGNQISGSSIGINLDSYLASNNNIISDNNILNNRTGVSLGSSRNSIIDNNTLTNNYYGIVTSYSFYNTIKNNHVSNSRSGIWLNQSNSNIIENNQVKGNNYGIELYYYSKFNTINNNEASANSIGLYLWYQSNDNIISANIVNANQTGIDLMWSANNTVLENTMSGNVTGLYLGKIAVYPSNNNIVYHNNFLNNQTQASVIGGSGNVFNLDLPIGGNYWSNWTTPDNNHDRIVDNPYVFGGGNDQFPWIRQDGWNASNDTIPPTTTISLTGSAGNNGWYVSDVTATLAANDNDGGAGIDKTLYSFNGINWLTYSVPFIINTEGITNIYFKSVDMAANEENPAKEVSISIDKTNPNIDISVPTNNAEYYLRQSVSATWTANDFLSGIASASGAVPSGMQIDTSTPGTKNFKVTAVDNAGNYTVKNNTYSVRYVCSGFLPPINADGSSVFKLGKTVPIKIRLSDAGGLSVNNAVAHIYVAKISDNVIGTEEMAVSTSAATTGNLLRYDSTDAQYIFNLSTYDLSIGTWQLRIALDDGSSQFAIISLK